MSDEDTEQPISGVYERPQPTAYANSRWDGELHGLARVLRYDVRGVEYDPALQRKRRDRGHGKRGFAEWNVYTPPDPNRISPLASYQRRKSAGGW